MSRDRKTLLSTIHHLRSLGIRVHSTSNWETCSVEALEYDIQTAIYLHEIARRRVEIEQRRRVEIEQTQLTARLPGLIGRLFRKSDDDSGMVSCSVSKSFDLQNHKGQEWNLCITVINELHIPLDFHPYDVITSAIAWIRLSNAEKGRYYFGGWEDEEIVRICATDLVFDLAARLCVCSKDGDQFVANITLLVQALFPRILSITDRNPFVISIGLVEWPILRTRLQEKLDRALDCTQLPFLPLVKKYLFSPPVSKINMDFAFF